MRNKAIAFYPEDHGLKMVQVYIYSHLGDLEAIQEVRDEMADSGAEEWMLGFIDVLISFNNENPPGTREAINWLLQKIRNNPGGLPEWLGTLALAQGDIQFSREIYLSDKPGWLEPDQWPALMGRDGRMMENGCIVAWLFMNTGDQELGTALLQQTTAFIEDALPLVTEHPDQLFPDLCYLTAGDTEKALLSIETQLTHNHLAHWKVAHQMPMYDLIRHEPRYQAAWAERERRINVQRKNIEKMAAEHNPELAEISQDLKDHFGLKAPVPLPGGPVPLYDCGYTRAENPGAVKWRNRPKADGGAVNNRTHQGKLPVAL